MSGVLKFEDKANTRIDSLKHIVHNQFVAKNLTFINGKMQVNMIIEGGEDSLDYMLSVDR